MNITIRKFNETDISNKVIWINDERNNKYLHYDIPIDYEGTVVWYNRNKDNDNRYDGVIEVDGIPCGLIGLLSIDRKNLKAEYYISMGNVEMKGKGVAKKASEEILEFAFCSLGLNKVYLYTEVDNVAAQKLFEKVGFKKEGRLNADMFYRGKFIDRYVYGICKSDYYFV